MPNYDYKCPICGSSETKIVPYDMRLAQRCGVCTEWTEWQFPVDAVRGIQGDIEPYYDEALDGDIHSRADRKMFMRSENLIEAGDARHGARNFDKHAPDHIKPQKPRGYTVWEAKDKQTRASEEARKLLNVKEHD